MGFITHPHISHNQSNWGITPTHTQLADLLTKALNALQLANLLTKMSIINIHNSSSHLEGECENAQDQKKKKKQMQK